MLDRSLEPAVIVEGATPTVVVAPLVVGTPLPGVTTETLSQELFVGPEPLAIEYDPTAMILQLQELLTQSLAFVPQGERNLRSHIHRLLSFRPRG